jgi:hypothetical protein
VAAGLFACCTLFCLPWFLCDRTTDIKYVDDSK